MAFKPGTGSPDYIPVHGDEYLGDEGNQACLDAKGMSVAMSLKFAPDKKVLELVLDVFWPKPKNPLKICPTDFLP